MSDSDEYNISEFLEQKGAIGILCQIDWDDSNTYGELEAAVVATSSPVSDRIQTAVNELDLLEQLPAKPEDHGHVKRYALTRRGKQLRAEMEARGVVDVYQEYFAAAKKLETEEDDLAEWVVDADITDPDWPYDPSPAADYFDDKDSR